MSDPFVAEIRIFPFGFAPVGWAQCNGQLILISQNTALFSLLGTTFGGNGTTNFALPDLQGSTPLGPGQGPGLSVYDLGQTGGETAVTLLAANAPAHPHALQADPRPATLNNPGSANSLARSAPDIYKTPAGANQPQPLSPNVLSPSPGGNRPHNNLMPYLTLNVCIALRGVYPARS